VSIERDAKYIAGLFLNDLPESLLWRYNGTKFASIVTPYRAPSWSWASREGQVYFYRIMNKPDWGDFARIDDVVLEYIDERNPFGQLRSGLMRITAPMVLIAWTDLTDNFWLDPPDSSNGLHDFSTFKGLFFFDESTLVRPRSGTSFLFVSYTCEALHGLILAPVDKSAQPQRWMRIGMFYLPLRQPENGKQRIADAIQYLEKYPKVTVELI
jgi:hypothetical protein